MHDFDDRMIHGQTVTRWAKRNHDGLIAVNDAAALNKFDPGPTKAHQTKPLYGQKEAFKEKSAKVTESDTAT